MLVFYSTASCLNLYYLYSEMTLREQEFSRLFQVLPSIMRNVRSMYVRANHFSRVRLFATPLARQDALSLGFSRQEYCGGLPWPPPEHLPHPGIEPVCYAFCVGRRVLYHELHLRSPVRHICTLNKNGFN